ncbi:MAG TPA: LPXTG cell wall anchor domain-containing protein [Acidimicrobiales bacterium]|nr:LPXTG cell wall anchor domain-containing protein [Acidimicrobiales bacterium]
MAVILSVLAWTILGSVAAASNYPPKPAAPQAGAPQPGRVVVVKGIPPRPRAALSRTGTSSTVPLLALGLGSVVVGTTLVGLSRRRRAADLLSDAASP